jgi:hypothetical protein
MPNGRVSRRPRALQSHEYYLDLLPMWMLERVAPINSWGGHNRCRHLRFRKWAIWGRGGGHSLLRQVYMCVGFPLTPGLKRLTRNSQNQHEFHRHRFQVGPNDRDSPSNHRGSQPWKLRALQTFWSNICRVIKSYYKQFYHNFCFVDFHHHGKSEYFHMLSHRLTGASLRTSNQNRVRTAYPGVASASPVAHEHVIHNIRPASHCGRCQVTPLLVRLMSNQHILLRISCKCTSNSSGEFEIPMVSAILGWSWKILRQWTPNLQETAVQENSC